MPIEDVGLFLIIFLFWYTTIPLCIARVSKIITYERITESIRGYIECRWPGSLLDYLVHCPICVSHWIGLIICIISIPVISRVSLIINIIGGPWTMFVIIWLSTVQLSILRIKDDN